MNDNSDNSLLDIFRGFLDLSFISLAFLVIVIFIQAMIVKVSDIASQALETKLASANAAATVASDQANQLGEKIADLERNLDVEKAKKDQAEAERDQANNQADQYRDDRDNVVERGQQERLAFDKEREHLIRSQSVYVAICCDASTSMKSSIESLNRTVRLIAETLPAAVNDFRLGIVFYRGGENITFKMTPIYSVDNDGGLSMRAAQSFVRALSLEPKFANIDTAADAAMAMLDAQPEQSKKLLFLIGDQSTGEMPYHKAGDDALLLDRIRSWAETPGSDRRVLGLYPSAQSSKAWQFFKDVGSTNANSEFGRDPSNMFSMIFRVAFRR